MLYVLYFYINKLIRAATGKQYGANTMRTKLPESIKTVNQAKDFLFDLLRNNESFHPEDDAFDIDWVTTEVSDEEKTQLNKLMNDIYSLPESWSMNNQNGFDPCGYILDNDPEYQKMTQDSINN